MVAASNGDATVLVAGAENGAPRAWVSFGEGFEPSPVESTGDEFAQVHDVAAFSGGFIAVGNRRVTAERPVAEASFLPRVWISADGRSWESPVTTGLSEPADITDVVATPRGLMAVGALRTGPDPAQGPFRPAVWTSVDGVSWTRATHPASGTDGYISALVATDEGVVALGDVEGSLHVWRTADHGASWVGGLIDGVAQKQRETWMVDSLTSDGTSLVAFGTLGFDPPKPRVLRADAGDLVFTAAGLDTTIAGGLSDHGAISYADDRWWITTSRDRLALDPDACYRDSEGCKTQLPPVLLFIGDGETWSEVDTTGMQLSAYTDFWDVIHTAHGPLVVGGADTIVVWRWTADTPPATLPAYAPPAPLDTPRVESDAALDVGVTYRYAPYTHCGIDYLGSFNGRFWYVDRAAGPVPDVEGEPIYGYVELVDESRIEYTDGNGKLIAVYAPSNKQPPPCM